MSEVNDRGDERSPYEIVRIIGSGGMGVVHEAWDTRLERRVAIKTVHPHLLQDPSIALRFENEAKRAARIEHPNVVRVYRVDNLDGRTVIEMQFIDGTPLNVLLQSGSLSPTHTANLLRQLLEALAACHAQGVIHCDLKPGNVLVTQDGHAVLTDFGIARALYGADMAGTQSGALSAPLWGTPQYCPPEAWEGSDVSLRWDLYAAGVLVYEAVTGGPAFSGQTRMALMKQILTSMPQPLSTIRPDVSGAFSRLVSQLMARDPELRPASAKVALAVLRDTPEHRSSGDAWDTQPLTCIGPDPSVKGADRSRRSTFVVSVMLAILLMAATVAGIAWPRSAGLQSGSGSITPTTRDPKSSNLLVIGDCGYFAADDGEHGRELWVADVAQGGECRLVADIVPGSGSSNPRNLMARPHGGFVFAATTPETGEELWYGISPDGSSYSIMMIKDILPGPMGSEPVPVASARTMVLFYATTLMEGRELWCTTGISEQQTALVRDLNPGVEGSIPMRPRVYGVLDNVYVVAIPDAIRGCVLFKYDFSDNTLREIGDVGEDTAPRGTANGKVFMANTDNDHGYELWTYDAKNRVLGMIADLQPGPDGSYPSEFGSWNDQVLFRAQTDEVGIELWLSDGSAGGTGLIKDINPGRADSDPNSFVPLGEYVFFRAKDDACGRELWVTNGTAAGTERVCDLMPGPESGEPYNMVARGPYLFFSAKDPEHGEELWRTHRDEERWITELVADLYPGPTGSEPHMLQWTDRGEGLFLAKTATYGITVCKLSPGFDVPEIALAGYPETTVVPLAIEAVTP